MCGTTTLLWGLDLNAAVKRFISTSSGQSGVGSLRSSAHFVSANSEAEVGHWNLGDVQGLAEATNDFFQKTFLDLVSCMTRVDLSQHRQSVHAPAR